MLHSFNLMLTVSVRCVVLLNVTILNVVMLSAVLLSVVMMNVIMMNVIMLNVVVPFDWQTSVCNARTNFKFE
jgi:hypothetical protein